MGIPVFTVVIRYNILNVGACNKWLANIIAVGVPWLLALIFYSGNALNMLITVRIGESRATWCSGVATFCLPRSGRLRSRLRS